MIPQLDHPNGNLSELQAQLAAFAAAAAAGEPTPPQSEPPPKKKPKPGRTADGKFAKGNSGGPGNPFARQVASFRQALYEAVTREMLKDLATRLWGMALGGNVAAARLLLQYLVGKPQDPPNPDRLEHDEWQTYQSEAVPPADVTRLLTSMPATMANGWANGVWPVMADCRIRQPMLDRLRADREQREAAAKAAEGEQARQPPPPAPTANGENGRYTPSEAPAEPPPAPTDEAPNAAVGPRPAPRQAAPDRAAAREPGRQQTARSAATCAGSRPGPRAHSAGRGRQAAMDEAASGHVPAGDGAGAPSTNGGDGGIAGPPHANRDRHRGHADPNDGRPPSGNGGDG
jgi:hypothetical protein